MVQCFSLSAHRVFRSYFLPAIASLAGLGVGGLILYVNKSVRVEEFCRYGDAPNAGGLRIGTVAEKR